VILEGLVEFDSKLDLLVCVPFTSFYLSAIRNYSVDIAKIRITAMLDLEKPNFKTGEFFFFT
jgi:hypothetical protein